MYYSDYYSPLKTQKVNEEYIDTIRRLPEDPSLLSIAITCVPCRQENGYFVPTSEAIIDGFGGGPQTHPLVNFLHRTASDIEPGNFCVLLDDIDVIKNWVLPQNYKAEDLMSTCTQFIQNMSRHLDKYKGPSILPISTFLDDYYLQDYYNFLYHNYEHLLSSFWMKESQWNERNQYQHFLLSPSLLRNAVINSYVARKIAYKRRGERKYTLEKGPVHDELVLRSTRRLANYIAQGEFVQEIGFQSYVPLYDFEVDYMRLCNASFPINDKYAISWQ